MYDLDLEPDSASRMDPLDMPEVKMTSNAGEVKVSKSSGDTPTAGTMEMRGVLLTEPLLLKHTKDQVSQLCIMHTVITITYHSNKS